jgi:hypothetical protein
MLLRLHVEARDTLMRVTRLPVDPNEPDVQTEARAEALELANQVAGRIPTLKVEIRGVVDAVNVVVKLDGRPMAAAAIAHGVRVNPGIRRVRAQAAGYITRERNIDVAESQERIVTMTMRKLPAGAKSEVVVDEDDQRVLLGGATNHLTTLGWIGIGVGGAGVLVGTIFGVLTISKEASLADSCPASRCPASERGDIDEALAFAEVSTAGFVSGAVGLGLGVAARGGAPAGAEISPALTLAPAGVVLEGTF